MKKINKILTNKLLWVLIAVVLQFAITFFAIEKFTEINYIVVESVFVIVKVLFLVKIVNSDIAPAYKLTWFCMFTVSTTVGVILYFFFGRNKLNKKIRKTVDEVTSELERRRDSYPVARADGRTVNRIFDYIRRSCASSSFDGNHVEYFSVGEEFFEKLFAELECASDHIFLDYFIVCDGKIWDRLFDILTRKSASGVDVRLIYDDIGSVMKIDREFLLKLKKSGIKVRPFNKLTPSVSSIQNYRDHRKICVIDGNTTFVGGINLSDEYANITHPFGHWKDTALMIKGPVTEAFSNVFLSYYDGIIGGVAIEPFRAVNMQRFEEEGIVAPYFDSPVKNIQIARNMYDDLITTSEKSICICTPYFVPDYNIVSALKTALSRKIKVEIILPGVYDKWYVRELSRLYASRLEKLGARVYEYKPGFLHQKMLIVDGKYAVTGSSNLDYRSFYLSFECGVFLYKCPVIKDMTEDFRRTVETSEIYSEIDKKPNIFRRIFRSFFAIFAPLL